MRKLTVGLILCFALSFYSDAQKTTKTKEVFEFNKSTASHNIKLIFKTKSFNPKEHKIEEITDKEKDWVFLKIDGKEPFGADGSFTPKTEIESVKLFWDGKEVPVEKEIFADCYLPNFEKESFWLKPSADGESMMTFMTGADGGLGYMVFWVFRKDGKHSRFIEHANDADYRGFVSGFFTED